MWEDFSSTVGFWADMEHPYVTYYDDYIESEWWALKEIWNKKLLYKGFKIVPYCPRCGTPLSAQEVSQGYKTVKERSAVVRFKVVGEDAYFLAWTTTPWTLPSNVALCVNPDETYCKVKAADGYTYYMAEALLDKVLGKLAKEEGEKAYEVLETYKGTDLEYKAYEPLFACAGEAAAKQKKKAHFVTCDNYVTMSDGTGIVHIAPAFGEDDSRIGRNYELPFVQFVDGQGNLTKETPYAGVFVKKADPMVLTDLDKEGKLFDAPKFEHDYPHCWRCDTPLIYYARESWFIKMTAVKDDLIRNNNTINWIPESIGKGRFGDWLENVQDWGISRNRYWGTPLNIWQCECGHMHSIGSRQELFEMSGDERAKTVELHRPYIDEITLKCPECGGEMHRVPEVIDCWFDSGAMPFAQHHYPFENKELFEQQFPANFISEAVDQTRGWFYSLLAESTLLFNKAPYKNVIVLGHVQDENGQKMSKSKGNAVDPFDALNKYGADAIRWYFYINSAPWLPNRFHGKAVVEGQRKFMSTLWNTYAFFVLYADIDNFDPTKYELNYDQLPVMDKWLLSRLNTTVQAVDNDLANYKIPEAARALQEFVDEMSNWYVRRSRERFWAKGMEQDKINAYMTLYHALVTIAKTAAPMIPFMTEDIYQNLVRSVDKDAPESIHLCDFPTVNEAWIDKDLEADMKELLEIVVLGRACRNTANIKNRQPIGTMYVKAEKKMSEFYTDIIADELNVKEVKFADDVESFISYSFKPQLRTVGPKYGKLLGGIRQALTDINGTAAMNELRTNGVLKLDINGNDVELTEEDLLIETAQTEGYVSESDGETSVVLDTNLTPELIEEGFVREIISKIQTMRKEAGFEVMDKIVVYAHGNDKIQDVMKTHEDEIKSEVLADEMVLGETDGYVKEWNINKEAVTMGVKKL
jgi:isoleucyl-tRNA synthetase